MAKKEIKTTEAQKANLVVFKQQLNTVQASLNTYLQAVVDGADTKGLEGGEWQLGEDNNLHYVEPPKK